MDVKGVFPGAYIRDGFRGKSVMTIYRKPAGLFIDYSSPQMHAGTDVVSYERVDRRKVESAMSIPSLMMHMNAGHITAEDVNRFMLRRDIAYQPSVPVPLMEPAEAF